jgi:uncharacterized membrane protein YedE/YeeE
MLSALIGGCLIGLAATLFWLENGRIAGVSGILRGALRSAGERGELLLFLAGLAGAGLLSVLLFPSSSSPPPPPPPSSLLHVAGDQPLAVLLAGGVLVGFGTRLARGCTSGHGLCGVSRLSARSLVATLIFVAAGALTVLAIARLAPGWAPT